MSIASPPRVPLANTLVRSVLSVTAGSFLSQGIYFLLTPYVIAQLGADRYGIWGVFATVAAYFALLDLGLGLSYVKLLAEYLARGDEDRANRLVNTGFVFHLAVSLSIVVAGLSAEGALFRTLNIPDVHNDEAQLAYYALLGVILLSAPLEGVRSLLYARQRLGVVSVIDTLATVANAATVAWLLAADYKLFGLAAGLVISALVRNVLTIAAAVRVFPALRFDARLWDWDALRAMWRYGSRVQLMNISGLVNFQVDRLLLSHLVGVRSVALYQVGASIASFARSIPVQLLPPILPAASELDAVRDRDRLDQLYWRASRYVALLAIGLLGFVTATASVLVATWIGNPEFAGSADVTRILLTGFVVNLLTAVPALIARGKGLLSWETRSAVMIPILHIVLAIVLIPQWAAPGAALGGMLALGTGSLYFLAAAHRPVFGWRLADVVQRVYLAPVLAAVVGAALVALVNAQTGNAFLESRVHGLMVLAVDCVVFGIAYFGCLAGSRYLGVTEVSSLVQAIVSGRRAGSAATP
ncbi:MAG: oligosaccharide flippase family protein [Chloroflexi bacterium]|nr:oligosaccharide flippase family protein [Chloroflexota bacterium]